MTRDVVAIEHKAIEDITLDILDPREKLEMLNGLALTSLRLNGSSKKNPDLNELRK